jgi:hypothetical protein
MEARKRSEAGGYAWKRHQRSLLPSLAVATLLMFAYPPIVFAYLLRDGLTWPLTLLSLLLVAVPAFLMQRYESVHGKQERGARAEKEVGRELEKLHKDGFHVFHDWYKEDRGNVDHFVVGPQGVFVIETKAWRGEISCKNDELLWNGRPPALKDPLKQVKGEAVDVKGLIEEVRGISTWVHPILCFSQAELRCYGLMAGVEMTNVGSLRRAIAGRPVVFEPERVRSISYFLERHLSVSPAARPGLPPEEPGRLRRLLRLDRVFVAIYLAYCLVLSFVFAGSTAGTLENLAAFYRAVEALVAFYV